MLDLKHVLIHPSNHGSSEPAAAAAKVDTYDV